MNDPSPLDVWMAMNSIHAPLIVRGDIAAGASFSQCERYRYTLWRTWDDALKRVMFLMLNPSTADENNLDPTVTRCKGFAKAWGYGGLVVCNIFAFRATNPKDLRAQTDPVGVNTNAIIMNAAHEVDKVIAAWGQHGKLHGRGLWVRNRFRESDIKLYYLRMGAGGMPHHPLYLPGYLKPQEWRRA